MKQLTQKANKLQAILSTKIQKFSYYLLSEWVNGVIEWVNRKSLCVLYRSSRIVLAN